MDNSKDDSHDWETLIGKTALLCISVMSNTGQMVGTEQWNTIITAASEKIGISLSAQGSDKRFSLPPVKSKLLVAKKGTYRFRKTGELMVDPDFLIYLRKKLP